MRKSRATILIFSSLLLLLAVVQRQSSGADENRRNSFVITGARSGHQIAYKRVELRINSPEVDAFVDSDLASVLELTISAASDELLAGCLERLANRLPSLKTLQLDWRAKVADSPNRLKPAITRFAATCPKLSKIRLDRWSSDATTPPPIDHTSLRDIRFLELDGFDLRNQLTSVLKDTQLEGLELLSSSYEQLPELSHDDIRTLQELKSLESLTIVGYVKKASELKFTQTFKQIRSLSLANCEIDELPRAPNIHTLQFTECTITPAVLRTLGDAKSLHTLVVRRSALSQDLTDREAVRVPESLTELEISSATPADQLPVCLLRAVAPHVRTRLIVRACAADDIDRIHNVTSFRVVCGCPSDAIKQLPNLEGLRELSITIDTASPESLAPLLSIPKLARLELYYRGDSDEKSRTIDVSQLPKSNSLKEIVFQGFPDTTALNWMIQRSPSLSGIAIIMTTIRDGDLLPVQNIGRKITLNVILCSLSRNCLRELLQGRNVRELHLNFNDWVDAGPSLAALLTEADSIESLRWVEADSPAEKLVNLINSGRISSLVSYHDKLTHADVTSLSAAQFKLGNAHEPLDELGHYFGPLIQLPK